MNDEIRETLRRAGVKSELSDDILDRVSASLGTPSTPYSIDDRSNSSLHDGFSDVISVPSSILAELQTPMKDRHSRGDIALQQTALINQYVVRVEQLSGELERESSRRQLMEIEHRSTVRNLEAEVQQLQTDLSARNNEANKLRSQLDVSKSQFDELIINQSYYHQLSQVPLDAMSLYEYVQFRVLEKTLPMQDELNQLRNTLDKAEIELREHEARKELEFRGVVAAAELARAKSSQSDDRLQILVSENERLNEKILDYKKKLQSFNEKAEEYDELWKSQDAALSKLSNANEKILELEAIVSNTRRELDDCTSRLLKKTAEVEELKESELDLRTECNRMRLRTQMVESELLHLRTQLADTARALEQSRAVQVTEKLEMLEKRDQEVGVELRRNRQEIAEFSDRVVGQVASVLRESLEDTKAELRATKDSLAKVSSEKEELSKAAEVQNQFVIQLRSDLKFTSLENARLMGELADAKTELQNARLQLSADAEKLDLLKNELFRGISTQSSAAEGTIHMSDTSTKTSISKNPLEDELDSLILSVAKSGSTDDILRFISSSGSATSTVAPVSSDSSLGASLLASMNHPDLTDSVAGKNTASSTIRRVNLSISLAQALHGVRTTLRAEKDRNSVLSSELAACRARIAELESLLDNVNGPSAYFLTKIGGLEKSRSAAEAEKRALAASLKEALDREQELKDLLDSSSPLNMLKTSSKMATKKESMDSVSKNGEETQNKTVNSPFSTTSPTVSRRYLNSQPLTPSSSSNKSTIKAEFEEDKDRRSYSMGTPLFVTSESGIDPNTKRSDSNVDSSPFQGTSKYSSTRLVNNNNRKNVKKDFLAPTPSGIQISGSNLLGVSESSVPNGPRRHEVTEALAGLSHSNDGIDLALTNTTGNSSVYRSRVLRNSSYRYGPSSSVVATSVDIKGDVVVKNAKENLSHSNAGGGNLSKLFFSDKTVTTHDNGISTVSFNNNSNIL